MTENEIKEMVKDIVNNDAKYECRFEGDPPFNNNEWIPYTLGEAIHIDWKYRKVETWCVLFYGDNDYRIFKDVTDCAVPCVFEGTKEECEKWIEEHTKKTWIEETFPYPKSGDVDEWCVANSSRDGASKVCKKILEEANNYSYNNDEDGPLVVELDDLKEIIKKLGVEY